MIFIDEENKGSLLHLKSNPASKEMRFLVLKKKKENLSLDEKVNIRTA